MTAMTVENHRVLILGLDGATWCLINPLLEAGELPNLKSLVETGSSGTLRSTVPPLTAPAWATFQTGANPGKHGVFDFRIFDPRSRQIRLVNSRDLRLPTLWQLASAAGRRVIAINVPVTFPPQPVNGIVVGGMLAQKEDETLIYPSGKASEILGRHPDYHISPPVISQRKNMGRKPFVEANIQVERRRCELALDLMAREPWDLFMVQNQCLDYIQHAYYHFMDPAAVEYDPAGYQDVIRFYRAMDENVGRLLAAVPRETDVVVLSDHGFKLQHRLIHLTPWLKSQGYLAEELDLQQRALQLLRRADVLRLRRRLAHWVLRDKSARFGAAASNALGRINWEKTRAFTAIGSVFGCLFINRDLIPDTENFCRELTDQLLNLIDPKTGKRVVKAVMQREEVYHGPFAVNGPDLIAEPVEDYSFGAPSLIAHRTPFVDIDFSLEIPGGHHPDGIFIWSGAQVRPGHQLPANLMDIAPTVLAQVGVPVPRHMDGEVLSGIFQTSPRAEYQDWESQGKDLAGDGYSTEDEQALSQRLADLGYL